MRLIELKRDWRMNKGLYLLILPIVVYLIIFNYLPMAGIVLGFERFTPKNGVYMSEWPIGPCAAENGHRNPARNHR